MSSSLNYRFSQIGGRHPPMNSRLVSRDTSGSVQITVVNDYSCLGPPPSTRQQQGNLRHPVDLRKHPNSTCHSNANIPNPADVTKRPNYNRSTGSTSPMYTQLNHIGSNRPVYNSPHGPITDLRELLTNRRSDESNHSSDANNQPRQHHQQRHFGAGLHQTRGNRDLPGFSPPSHSNSDAYYGRGRRHGRVRGTLPTPSTNSKSIGRRRGRQYWKHDDRLESRHFPQHPTEAPLDTRVADEYIDDFNPEDLAKYKLDIDMDEAPAIRTTKPQPAKHQRYSRGRRPFKNRRTFASSQMGHESAKSPRESQMGTVNHPTAEQQLRTNDEYLKPAFQLWMDSGLGSVPRQRHTSEISLPKIAHRSPFELYPSMTWPTLRVALSSSNTTPGSGVCELMPGGVTNRGLHSTQPWARRCRSSNRLSPSCGFVSVIRSRSV